MEAIRFLHKALRSDAQLSEEWQRRLADLEAEVRVLAESLGTDGGLLGTTKATGLHKAVAEGFDRLRNENAERHAEVSAEIMALSESIKEALAQLSADRTARLQAIRDEEVRADALAKVRAPLTSSLAEARREAVRWLVLLVLGAVATLIYRHVH